MMAVNVTGVFNVWQAALSEMKDAGQGRLIAVASTAGLKGYPYVAGYVAAKHGVVGLTRALALELAVHDIRVNALAPGYVETDLTRDYLASDVGKALLKRIPQRRPANMSELDGPLLLLCSDASSYMTGAVLAVDGGHLVSSL